MSENYDKKPISEWAEDDRPREKLLLKGKHALSNAELIAILIGSGNRTKSAVELAQEIMDKAGNNLIELSKFTVRELTAKFNGIGTAKAISIIAALELGKRRLMEQALKKKKVSCSNDAFEILTPFLADRYTEEFRILLLDRANQVIGNISVGQGGFSSTVADPKSIFKEALAYSASGIILAHNHPSGNRNPSDADVALTRKLKRAGDDLEIQILDHIIVTADGYYSFADEGKL